MGATLSVKVGASAVRCATVWGAASPLIAIPAPGQIAAAHSTTTRRAVRDLIRYSGQKPTTRDQSRPPSTPYTVDVHHTTGESSGADNRRTHSPARRSGRAREHPDGF